MFTGGSMKERLLRSIIREELKRLTEFAPSKFSNISLDAPESDKSMSDDEVSRALDNALKGRHASGRPFSSQFRSSLHENTEQSASVNYGKFLAAMTQYEMFEDQNIDVFSNFNSVDNLFKQGEITNDEMDIIISIMLFTGGNVATVRDTDLYSPAKAAHSSINLFRKRYQVTLKSYQTANKIMTDLAMSKNYFGTSKIYRGLTLDSDVFDSLKEDIEFNNHAISSFTSDKEVAIGFSKKFLREPFKPVLIIIKNPTHGSDISRFSYYKEESEVVLGKKIKIQKIISQGDAKWLFCDIIP
jgi:hypothetical protein